MPAPCPAGKEKPPPRLRAGWSHALGLQEHESTFPSALTPAPGSQRASRKLQRSAEARHRSRGSAVWARRFRAASAQARSPRSPTTGPPELGRLCRLPDSSTAIGGTRHQASLCPRRPHKASQKLRLLSVCKQKGRHFTYALWGTRGQGAPRPSPQSEPTASQQDGCFSKTAPAIRSRERAPG